MDDEAKLTLHGLVQHYIMLNEEEKNRKLNDLLDALDFNQVTASTASTESPRDCDMAAYKWFPQRGTPVPNTQTLQNW